MIFARTHMEFIRDSPLCAGWFGIAETALSMDPGRTGDTESHTEGARC